MKAAALAILARCWLQGGRVRLHRGTANGLEDLANKSDVIFKGTVELNTTVNDANFGGVQGFAVQETVLSDVRVPEGRGERHAQRRSLRLGHSAAMAR